MSDLAGPQSHGAAPSASGPSARAMPLDQQPATKADLYAAVDAMRADMRELLDQISTLIKDASQK